MSDKRASEVRRPYRQQECKWFHKIDECHWSKSIIHNQILTSTTLSFQKKLFHLHLYYVKYHQLIHQKYMNT